MLGGLALKRRWQHARRAAGQARRPAQHRHGRQRPDLLGQVRQLLRRRAPPRPDGGRPAAPRRRRGRRARATRTPSASSRSSARRSTAATSRSPTSAPRSTTSQERTGLDVPVHVDGASGAMIAPFLDPELVVGLPPAPRRVDQHVGPQVRPGLPRRRLGGVARPRRAARGPGLPRQLPRRRDADVRAQLLPSRRPGHRAVLQLPAARPRRLPPRPALLPGRGHAARRRDRRPRPVPAAHRRHAAARLRVRGRRRAAASPSSTSPPGCASRAGSSPRTRSRRTGRTSPCCASSCATASPTTSPTCCSTTCAGSSRACSEQTAPARGPEAASFSHGTH